MKNARRLVILALAAVLAAGSASAQSRGLKLIRAEDQKAWLEFLAAREFEGRNAPSAAYDIAARYVALEAGRIGLKPLLQGGEWFQRVPFEVTTISPAKSRLRVLQAGGESILPFPQAFGAAVRTAVEGAAAGGLVYVAPLPALTPVEGEKALGELAADFRGKIAVVLAAPPASPTGGGAGSATTLIRFLRGRGALGLVTIISPEREKNLEDKGLSFDVSERLRFPSIETSVPGAPAPAASAAAPALPFHQIEVRHETGALLLGTTRAGLDRMFAEAGGDRAVSARAIEGRTLEIAVYFDRRMTTSPNVVGWVEGSDPKLKGEYVVISSHIDHLAVREGRVFPGADDNGSGTVAMLSLAKAFVAERPRRSVIFLWNTAEEDGLVGAYHFVQHCPVPVERISANLNLDMISRNDPDMIYLIGSNKISSELDRSLRDMNARSVRMKLDYAYENPLHSDRFFFRSDQYPFIRYGVPGVWIFCGTTADYHQEGDTFERADFVKAEKVTRLTYRVALDIGNKPALLKLDLHPEITTRGAHNMKVNWQRPAAPSEKR